MTKAELEKILFFLNDAQTTIEVGEDLNYTMGEIELMRGQIWQLYHAALEAEPMSGPFPLTEEGIKQAIAATEKPLAVVERAWVSERVLKELMRGRRVPSYGSGFLVGTRGFSHKGIPVTVAIHARKPHDEG